MKQPDFSKSILAIQGIDTVLCQNCCFSCLWNFLIVSKTFIITYPHICIHASLEAAGSKSKRVTMSSDFITMSRGKQQGWVTTESCQGMISLLLCFLWGSQVTLEDKSHLPTQSFPDHISALTRKSAWHPLSMPNYA